MDLESSIEVFIEEKYSYYKQWIFDEPIIISLDRYNRLDRLQKLMYQLIKGFVNNYWSYDHLMPQSESVVQLLKMYDNHNIEYRVGTYRTDFVYDHLGQEKMIEITCRFALNGVFLSQLMNYDASRSNISNSIEIENIVSHLKSYIKGDKVYILKGNDQRNESKIYEPILKRSGIEVISIYFNEIHSYLGQIKDELIISELSFDEILSIPYLDIQELIGKNMINDFRTVFLIHDKRFFSVLCDEKFQQDFLDEEDRWFLSDFLVPTYSGLGNESIWNSAKNDKDKWIIKHRALGKSQSVYAGIVSTEEEWCEIFPKTERYDYVLQRWVPQRKYRSFMKNEMIDDYITGTLMFFDNHFFGFGDFRTSSFPITNKVDHRKMSSVIVSNIETIAETKKRIVLC